MPRLYHTKSRSGCVRCRARRVKCDETRPACVNCTRHEVSCVYDREPGAPRERRSGTAEGSPQESSSNEAPTAATVDVLEETSERRLLELRLLYLFRNEICQTLPGTYQTETLQRWTIDVLGMAMENETLLNAVLSLSILYILITGKEDRLSRDTLLAYRAKYMNATLNGHRHDLQTFSNETAERTTFTSIVLSTDAMACLRDRVLQPYEPPLLWLQMSQGTKHVTVASLGLAQGHPTSKIYRLQHSSSYIWDRTMLRTEANLKRFPHLLEPYPDDMDMETDDDVDEYTDAVCFIAAAEIGRLAGEDTSVLARRLIIFPCFIKPRFVEQVAERKPRTLAILAHFFGVALMASDCWWIGESAVNEILAIKQFLGPEWEDRLAWPTSMVELRTGRAGLGL